MSRRYAALAGSIKHGEAFTLPAPARAEAGAVAPKSGTRSREGDGTSHRGAISSAKSGEKKVAIRETLLGLHTITATTTTATTTTSKLYEGSVPSKTNEPIRFLFIKY
jgi:hypothetical protein